MKYAPKKSFAGEYKFTPVAHKSKRVVLNQNGDVDEIIINPPVLPSYDVEPVTTIDFPRWSMLSCDEILKAIASLQETLTYIKASEAVIQQYYNEIELGKKTYESRCPSGTKDDVPPPPPPPPPSEINVIVPPGGPIFAPPTGGTGGGGGAKEEKESYSWLWLVLMAAGVYVLTRKSE